MSNDIILTGPPRSGTTLTCSLLNKVSDTIALHEPMNLQMFHDPESSLKNIRNFFNEMRTSLIDRGEAISKVSKGKIPSNPFGDNATTGRKSIVKKDHVHFDKALSSDFNLIIKHNGHFIFLLQQLQELYPVYIILRNPVATIASWNSIDAPVSDGNLRVLETLNPQLYHSLNLIPDVISRQVVLLDKMYQEFILATKAIFVRYEDIINSGGNILKTIIPAASQLAESLVNKNTNPLYDAKLLSRIKDELIKVNGAYLSYYQQSVIESY